MNVTLLIPDELAARFGSPAELGRRAVELLALEEYRAGRLTRTELKEMLGLTTEGELEGLLQAHGQVDNTDRATQDQNTAENLVAQFRAFAAGHTLGGLDLKELISEGRR